MGKPASAGCTKQGGVLYNVNYAKLLGRRPYRKKSLFHFYPEASVISGGWGCNFPVPPELANILSGRR
jgi:hypothetical protein